MQKLQTIREMTRGEVEQKVEDLLEEQFNLNMQRSLRQLDNPLRLRHVRRELAQLKTVLREDDLGVRKLAESRSSILSQTGGKEDKKG